MPSPKVAHLYNAARWARTRRAVFARDGYLCQCGCGMLCTGKHPAPNSPECDHIELALRIVSQHGVDAFYDLDRLQTLSKGCHDRWKSQIEAKGYSDEVGPDGWPVDQKHPVNRR